MRVAEELLALARGALERVLELVLGQRDPEALAAAAAGGLDRDRIADRLLDHLACVIDRRHRLGGARDDRHAGLGHQLAGAGLRPHRLDRGRRRADEHGPRCPPAPGRRRRSRPGSRSRDARPRRRSAPPHRAASRSSGSSRRPGPGPSRYASSARCDVQRVAVELGVHGHSCDPELLAGAHDSDRDLAAVGDQDLREHAAGHFTGYEFAGRPGARTLQRCERAGFGKSRRPSCPPPRCGELEEDADAGGEYEVARKRERQAAARST